MALQFYTADVFTDKAFGGNQLAIIPDARGLTDEQMTSITREFNFSESTFVFPPEDPRHTRRVRIFTPGYELPFAGHPTVGTAIVLALSGDIPLTGEETQIVFEEGVGPCPVTIRAENGKAVFAQLTTAQPPEKRNHPYAVDDIAAMLSLESGDVGEEIEAWSVGVPYVVVPIRSIEALGRARIRYDVWERVLKDTWAPEVFLFTEQEEGVVRARMFAPTLGIPEDPATGSAAGSLAGYRAARATQSDGTLRFTVHQGVEMGRPSRLEVEVDLKGGAAQSVRVGGAAVLVSSGTLHVP